MPFDRANEWKRSQLKTERGAFADTPIENIRFTVGQWSKSATWACVAFGVFAFFSGNRIHGQMEYIVTPTGLIEDFLCAVAAVTALLFIGYHLLHTKLHIQATGFRYRGEIFGSSEIQKLVITENNRIQIYKDSRKIVSYAWDDRNTDKLIAWARKCRIRIEDGPNVILTESNVQKAQERASVSPMRPAVTENIAASDSVIAALEKKLAGTEKKLAETQQELAKTEKLLADLQKSAAGSEKKPQKTIQKAAASVTRLGAAPGFAASHQIGEKQYKGRKDLVSFTVPDGVTVIGKSAFEGCICLETVTLPDSLACIERNAFRECSALRSIRIPDRVKKIEGGAFYKCTALEQFRFPKGMNGTQLDYGMFYDCKLLESVELPEKLVGEFGNIFPNCESLRSIKLPEGISIIGSFTFQSCKMLKMIEIPSTVRHIGYKAFNYCISLTEMYIPDTVKTMDAYHTFLHCSGMERLRLPVGLIFKSVFPEDDSADMAGCCFRDCDALKTVILGEKEFEIEGPLNDNLLRTMYAELAADGNIAAQEVVKNEITEVMKALILSNNDATAERLLTCQTVRLLTSADVRQAADFASANGSEHILALLKNYAEQRGISLN